MSKELLTEFRLKKGTIWEVEAWAGDPELFSSRARRKIQRTTDQSAPPQSQKGDGKKTLLEAFPNT